jgi:biopolymer transport protein TolQ
MPNNPLNSSLTHLILSSGVAAKFVLVALLICSVVAWTIIFSKILVFQRSDKENRRFLTVFRKSNTFYELKKLALVHNAGPIWSLFKSVIDEIDTDVDWDRGVLLSEREGRLIIGLERTLRSSIQNEIDYYERHIYLLATLGNTAPFVGLFGTVWGMMNSFRAMGLQETANIAVVAPGVAEALIATAAGLATAIPAVIAYNLFVNRVGRLEIQLDIFASDLLRLIDQSCHTTFPKSEVM